MKRHCIAMAASVCALVLAPSAALAGTNNDRGGTGLLGGLVKQTQSAGNQNSTEQSASSEASSQQTNVNAPVAILSSGSNDGNVDQSNTGTTSSQAGNGNRTQQGNTQTQNGSAKGGAGDGQRG